MSSGRTNNKACVYCREKHQKCIPGPGNRCQPCIDDNVSICGYYHEKKRGRKSKLDRLALEHSQEDQHDLPLPRQAAKRTRTASKRVKATFAFIPSVLPARPPSPPAGVMSVADTVGRTLSPEPVWTLHASNQEAAPGDDVYAPASPRYHQYNYPLSQPMMPAQQAEPFPNQDAFQVENVAHLGYYHPGLQHMMPTQQTGGFFPNVPSMDPVIFGHYAAAQPLAEPLTIPTYRFTFDPVDYGGINPWPQVLPQLTEDPYHMKMPFEGIDPATGLGLFPVNTSLDDVTNYNPW